MKYKKERVNIQRSKLILYHLLTYLIIFIFLGLIATVLINYYFFKGLLVSVRNYEDEIQNTIEEIQTSSGDQAISVASGSARISVAFYDEDNNLIAFDSDILSYIIEEIDELNFMIYRDGYRYKEKYEEYVEIINAALDSEILKVDESLSNKFDIEVVQGENKYYFQTLSFEVDNPNAPSVKSCKLLVMINGEITARNEIFRIYILSAGLMFILGLIASLLLSSWALRPVKFSLDKQLNFVSNASHELLTPLAIVQSKLENILTTRNKTVYEVSSDIAVSLREISRLSKLTNDLLTLAKNDNDIFNLKYEKFNLKELVEDVVIPFKEISEIQNKKFDLVSDDILISADKSMIAQVIIIILDNALKYTSEGESISINIVLNNNDCIITISDTGIGVDDKTKKHIFERFYRADKARSRETGGNGLGLAIAKTIVEQHKGHIKVLDNEPKGTKFVIIIPKNK